MEFSVGTTIKQTSQVAKTSGRKHIYLNFRVWMSTDTPPRHMFNPLSNPHRTVTTQRRKRPQWHLLQSLNFTEEETDAQRIQMVIKGQPPGLQRGGPGNQVFASLSLTPHWWQKLEALCTSQQVMRCTVGNQLPDVLFMRKEEILQFSTGMSMSLRTLC